MSADNWTTCPRCMKNATQKKAKLQKQVQESYGKIPVEEYDSVRVEVEKDISLEETLREDYQFYMGDDGNFSASYRAHCNICDFLHEFEHTKQLKIDVQ